MSQHHNRIVKFVAIRPQPTETYEQKFRRFLQAVVEGSSDNLSAVAPLNSVIDTSISERWTLGKGGGNDV